MCGLSKKQLYRRQFQQRPLKIKAAVRYYPFTSLYCMLHVHTGSIGRPLLRVVKSIRSVSFHSFVKVILVPCIAEYREAGMFDTLWWGQADFKMFRQAAAAALREFMHKRKLVNKRDALRLFILEGAIDDEA
ncbi:hypothetical protein B484DRAFT_411112 [Ochromonadaceae sp. CCMP2298]|nr:hypothetical protein B484DRAFT_411112 [Ochromonadaceae sp. CCMP2298]